MKTNKTNYTGEFNSGAFAACLRTCKKMLAQIKTVKNAILREYSDTRTAHKHLLELALNEAEALAWETDYPHLLFPTLAVEKARAVSTWNARQRFVQHHNGITALAA
jgi:hypothetical protein